MPGAKPRGRREAPTLRGSLVELSKHRSLHRLELAGKIHRPVGVSAYHAWDLVVVIPNLELRELQTVRRRDHDDLLAGFDRAFGPKLLERCQRNAGMRARVATRAVGGRGSFAGVVSR